MPNLNWLVDTDPIDTFVGGTCATCRFRNGKAASATGTSRCARFVDARSGETMDCEVARAANGPCGPRGIGFERWE